MEATFPVEKKADWRRVRKKRAVRKSERVSERKGDGEIDGGRVMLPCAAAMGGRVDL